MAKSLRMGLATSSRLLALASCLALLAASDAAAQGKRARLSEDLERKIQAGDASATSVILSWQPGDR